MDDLRLFKNQIASSLDHEYTPATVPSPAQGWPHRSIASLRGLFQWTPGLAFGAALTVLLLALSGWLIWRTLREKAPNQGIAVSPIPRPQPAPEPPVSQAAVQLVAQLNDGSGRLTLDQNGALSGADDLPPAYQSLLKEALTKRRIETSPQLKGLTRPPSSLMGADKDGSEFFVIEPVGRVLLTDLPTFRWSPMEGATGYVVEVYDEKFNLKATSPQLTRNSWAAPQSLSRGSVFTWQVKAIKDSQEFTSPHPSAPQARFRILDQAKASELTKARRDYASSHLSHWDCCTRRPATERGRTGTAAATKSKPRLGDCAKSAQSGSGVTTLRRVIASLRCPCDVEVNNQAGCGTKDGIVIGRRRNALALMVISHPLRWIFPPIILPSKRMTSAFADLSKSAPLRVQIGGCACERPPKSRGDGCF